MIMEGISMGDNSISAIVAIGISIILLRNLYIVIVGSWQLAVGSGQKQLTFNLQTANC